MTWTRLSSLLPRTPKVFLAHLILFLSIKSTVANRSYELFPLPRPSSYIPERSERWLVGLVAIYTWTGRSEPCKTPSSRCPSMPPIAMWVGSPWLVFHYALKNLMILLTFYWSDFIRDCIVIMLVVLLLPHAVYTWLYCYHVSGVAAAGCV